MTIYNAPFISFALAVLLALEAGATAPSFTFALSPATIEPGARAKLTLVLTGTRPETRARVNEELLADSKDLVILERSFKVEDHRQVWEIELTGYKKGTLRVPPLEVQYGDNSFSTENRELVVSSSRPEEDNELRPEFGSVGLPQRWDLWGRIALWVGLFAGAVWAAFKVRVVWKSLRGRHFSHFRDTEAPQVWLKMRLDRINGLVEQGADEKVIWSELAAAVRGYFARCSLNPVEAWTTGEFELKLTRYPEARRLLPLLQTWDRRFERTRVGADLSAKEALQRTERILLPWAS